MEALYIILGFFIGSVLFIWIKHKYIEHKENKLFWKLIKEKKRHSDLVHLHNLVVKALDAMTPFIVEAYKKSAEKNNTPIDIECQPEKKVENHEENKNNHC